MGRTKRGDLHPLIDCSLRAESPTEATSSGYQAANVQSVLLRTLIVALLFLAIAPAAHAEVVSLSDPIDQNNQPCLGGWCAYYPDIVSAAASLDPVAGTVEVRVRFAEPITKSGYTKMSDYLDAALSTTGSCTTPASTATGDLGLSGFVDYFPRYDTKTQSSPWGLSVTGASGNAPIDTSTRENMTVFVMKATNPVLIGRTFNCLTVSMTTYCESCNYYLGAIAAYDRASGTTPGSSEAFGDAPETTPAPAVAAAAKAPRTPTGVTYSRSRRLTARFTAETGVTYSITARKNSRIARGTCSVSGGAVTCRVRLAKAGKWVVSITPTRAGLRGKASTKTIRVQG